ETAAPAPAPVELSAPVVEAAPVDLPWEAPAAQSPVQVAEPVAQVAASVPEATAAVQPEPTPAVSAPSVAAAPVEEGDDDEPPPGDYDYYEADADSLDYDFDAPAAAPAEPEPLPAAQPATGLAAEWLDLFPRLGLSGMTGSIGANCTLVEANGDDWLLHLDPAHSALFNATQQRRLTEALNQHLGRSLNLRIELLRPEQETPAQAAARKRAERQRLAEQSIHDDPLVQQMIQQFGASIRPDSIEPLTP
uniref:DNA polymerase III subunit gamma/tau C-terminal domain-containing protein n=1 Tax=Aquipseudomonas alcaligenes TaxID=43263 RepID=UPI00242D7357